MSDIKDWSNTAASNNATPPDGFPEGMNPSDVNNAAREVMAAVRRQHEDSAWIDLGDTPTQTSATTFTIAGDVTASYTVGRRIRCTDASTLYGEITSSSFSSPDTTVTVALDSGSLSVSLTAVALSVITSEANGGTTSGNLTVTGDLSATGTVLPTGDTAAGDAAAVGYTAAEGLILTGQGSTNDVTIKNDADADVITIATGGTNVAVAGKVTAGGDTSAGDASAIGYTATEGAILTGQGSTNDITLKNDADAEVVGVPTGTTIVELAGGLVLNERADHDATPVAAKLELWGKNETPNFLIWTDDAGTDFRVGTTESAYTSLSSTSVDFTSLPGNLRWIVVNFIGMSTNGSSAKLIQIGTGGIPTTSGYSGAAMLIASGVSPSGANYTAGVGIQSISAAHVIHGAVVFGRAESANNRWVARGTLALSSGIATLNTASSVSLSGELDMVRITTANGTDTFDAGSVMIAYGC